MRALNNECGYTWGYGGLARESRRWRALRCRGMAPRLSGVATPKSETFAGGGTPLHSIVARMPGKCSGSILSHFSAGHILGCRDAKKFECGLCGLLQFEKIRQTVRIRAVQYIVGSSSSDY